MADVHTAAAMAELIGPRQHVVQRQPAWSSGPAHDAFVGDREAVVPPTLVAEVATQEIPRQCYEEDEFKLLFTA